MEVILMKFTVTSSLLSLSLLVTFALSSVTKIEFTQAAFNDIVSAEELTKLWNELAPGDQNEYLIKVYNSYLKRKTQNAENLDQFNKAAVDKECSFDNFVKLWCKLPDYLKNNKEMQYRYAETGVDKIYAEEKEEERRKQITQKGDIAAERENDKDLQNILNTDIQDNISGQQNVIDVQNVNATCMSNIIQPITQEELECDATNWLEFFKNSTHKTANVLWNHKGKILTAAGFIYAYQKGYLTKENLQTLKNMITENSTKLYESATKENMKDISTYLIDKAKTGYNAINKENMQQAASNAIQSAYNWVHSFLKNSPQELSWEATATQELSTNLQTAEHILNHLGS